MSDSAKPEILVERPEDGIAIVRINRPEVRNALNVATRRKLAEAFAALSEDETVRAIILTGDDQAFAAGADLREFIDATPIDLLLRHTERLWRAVSSTPQPVIAAINGFALGGGLELAMHADIIIAGEGAKFGQPEVRVGIMPGAGGTQRLTRAIGKFHTMKLCLTGRPIDAPEAFQIGLISKLVADDQVMPEALKMARDLATLPPIAVQQIKEVIVAGEDCSLETGLMLERKAMQMLFASEDKTEGMQAFFEKRKPVFKGR
ncbi:MAG: enoyl-CoA hydratase [Alphaproteobacteria bacterium]|nr:enoyl-CoA hydratase [Alphaproteobacteria bacterium]MBU0795627.1 enoyl-CoA hydratase [Alphaproteobacteria bacterium]MBU0887684.1 enoyl-CoA hydratase [Alphaproteobacteria bacterium]MBU1812889.1 enoyl-CoA hydratase [Alphaproteobacteria bacterium]